MNLSLLDFDHDFVCSVTLAGGKNIYCCLECGKFFQGRQIGTPAYEHSVSLFHSEFLNLSSGNAYSLPDGIEVEENEIIDILKENLTPQKYSSEIAVMEDLQGRRYTRGLVPLIKTINDDPMAALIHLIARIKAVVEQLLYVREGPERLVILSRVMKKLWMQDRMLKGRILLPILHIANTNLPEKLLPMLLQGLDLRCLQGKIAIITNDRVKGISTSEINFTMLSIDLPPIPLFPDPNGKLPIPQVPLADLIHQKYNSGKVHYDSKGDPVAYDILSLPDYLVITINGRLINNSRNGTVLLYDTDALQVPFKLNNQILHANYKLQAAICVDAAGKYVCILRVLNKEFYLHDSSSAIKQIQPESVILFDAVVQLWIKCSDI